MLFLGSASGRVEQAGLEEKKERPLADLRRDVETMGARKLVVARCQYSHAWILPIRTFSRLACFHRRTRRSRTLAWS
jgi:hypothetical protein